MLIKYIKKKIQERRTKKSMDKIILELKKLLEQGAISQEEFNFAMSKLTPESENPSNAEDTSKDVKDEEQKDIENESQKVEEIEEEEKEEDFEDDEKELENEEIHKDEDVEEEQEEKDKNISNDSLVDEESSINLDASNVPNNKNAPKNQENLDTTSQGDNPLNIILKKLEVLEEKVNSLTKDVDPTKSLGTYDNTSKNYVQNDYGPGVRTIYSK